MVEDIIGCKWSLRVLGLIEQGVDRPGAMQRAVTGLSAKVLNERLRKRVRGLTPEVAEVFKQYKWPGNVRELRNVIERVMILEDGDLITPAYLPRGLVGEEGLKAQIASRPVVAEREAPASEAPRTDLFQLPPEGVILDEVEMSLVRQAMTRSGGNQTRAAELLGISRDQLRYRLKKLEDASAQ